MWHGHVIGRIFLLCLDKLINENRVGASSQAYEPFRLEDAPFSGEKILVFWETCMVAHRKPIHYQCLSTFPKYGVNTYIGSELAPASAEGDTIPTL